jgi:hypothetical protein
MRGAVIVTTPLDGVRILEGEAFLTEYRFHTGVARHFFCSRCGIYTHHQRRYEPREFAVNVACLEGVSPFDFPEVPVVDGIRHPKDQAPGATLQIAGTIRFEPVSPPTVS